MERQQFEKLAMEHLDAVYRMAFHLTRNPDEAEDLTQEVYLRALRPSSSENFETRGGGMRAWLFTIAHNTFYSRIKREKRAPRAVAEFFAEEADATPPDEAPPAWNLATLDWEHVDGRIKRAIEELRPEFREVLLMWGVEGLKYREIGEILQVPIGTVMSRLHRARKLVAEKLGEQPGASEELGLSHRTQQTE